MLDKLQCCAIKIKYALYGAIVSDTILMLIYKLSGWSFMSEYVQDTLAEMTLKMVGDRWKVLIIQNLLDGTKRFGELKKELGNITQKVLTSNLRLLEEKGILVRKVYAQIPPRVDYTLTQLGYELKPVIDSMIEWAEEYRKNMAKVLKIELKD